VAWLDWIAGAIHESYLQSMGVGAGVAAYDHAAELALRYEAGRR
jgi:hypothetical protein